MDAALKAEFEATFGEALPSVDAAKSGWVADGYGYVDVARPADGVVWSKYGAATAALVNPAASACIKKRVDTIAGASWATTDRKGTVLGASDDPDTEEPVAALIHAFSRRNDGISLMGLIQNHKAVTGEAYLELVRGADRVTVDALELLNSLSVTPFAQDNVNITYFQYTGARGVMMLPPRNIVYDRYRHNLLTEIHGYSPLMTAIGSSAIGIMQAAGRAALAYWNNNGLPHAILNPTSDQKNWNDKAIADIRKTLRDNKGAGNQYSTGIFPYPFDSTVFDAPDLTKWADLLRSIAPQVYTAFNVPRSVAGDSDNQALQASPLDLPNFHEWARNELTAIEGVFNTVVIPAVYGTSRPPVTLVFDKTPYRHVDEQQILRVERAFDRGIITSDEYRQAIGFQVLEAPAAPPPAQLAASTDASAQPSADAEKDADTVKLSIALDFGNQPDLIALQQRVAKMAADAGADFEPSPAADLHLTLAHAPAVDAPVRDAILEAVRAIPVPQLSLTVGSLKTFDGLGRYAVHFRTRSNSALADYQRDIVEAVTEAGGQLSAFSQPAAFKAHITVGYTTKRFTGSTFQTSLTVQPAGLVVWCNEEVAYRSASGDVITPDAPLTVNPPVPTKAIHDTMWEEFTAWRLKAKRHGARKALNFESVHIDPDYAAHVRYGLRDGDIEVFARVSAAIRGELPPVMPEDVKALCDARLMHWQDMAGEDADYSAALKTFALGVLGAKSIQATRGDFEANVETLLFEAVEGTSTNAQFQARMRSLLQTTVYKAYVDGMRDGGVDDLPTETDDEWINRHIAEQYQYVRGIAEAIYKDGRVTEDEAAGKPELWFNKSVYPAYAAGLESAAKDALLEWVIDPVKENCDSCLALNGQRRRASFWKRNILPKADSLQCGGFRCGCGLKITSGAASKGKLPRWRFAAKSAGIAVHDHGHTHEHDGGTLDAA
jgi:2'-5' RNA ligase